MEEEIVKDDDKDKEANDLVDQIDKESGGGFLPYTKWALLTIVKIFIVPAPDHMKAALVDRCVNVSRLVKWFGGGLSKSASFSLAVDPLRDYYLGEIASKILEVWNMQKMLQTRSHKSSTNPILSVPVCGELEGCLVYVLVHNLGGIESTPS